MKNGGTITIAICDDDALQLTRILNSAKAFFSDSQYIAEIDTYDSPMAYLNALETRSYNLVFLDICMPGLSGIEVAQEMRRANMDTAIIFLTTSREYAIDAFQVDAIHYLIKPYTEEAFRAAADKALRTIGDTESYIVKKVNGVMQRIAVQSIVYIESDKHYVDIVTDTGNRYRIRATIEDMEEELAQFECFGQPHKSYLVNFSYIDSMPDNSVSLREHGSLPVSKHKQSAFKQAYMAYVFHK